MNWRARRPPFSRQCSGSQRSSAERSGPSGIRRRGDGGEAGEADEHERDEDEQHRQREDRVAEQHGGGDDQQREGEPVEDRLDDEHVARELGAGQLEQPARQLDADEVAGPEGHDCVREVRDEEDAEQRWEWRLAVLQQHAPAVGVDRLREREGGEPEQHPAEVHVREAAQPLQDVDAPDEDRDGDRGDRDLAEQQAAVTPGVAQHAGFTRGRPRRRPAGPGLRCSPRPCYRARVWASARAGGPARRGAAWRSRARSSPRWRARRSPRSRWRRCARSTASPSRRPVPRCYR